MTKNILLILVFLTGVFLSFFTPEQEQYLLTDHSFFKISGTSSLHDWEMNSHIADGKAGIEISGDSIKNIGFLKVGIPAKSLKSGINAMDHIAYSSLKADKHPRIEFTLQKINRIIQEKNSVSIEVTGSLLVAGKKRTIELKATAEIQNNKEICFEGKHSMQMTEFDIKPPTALLGTIKTGDRISVYFKVIFKPEKTI